MPEEFFVTLFSNTSQDLYPNNVMSRFTCKLPRPIKLEGNFRVGLVEIQFPTILGIVSNSINKSDENEDQVELPTPPKLEEGYGLSLKDFAHAIVLNAKQPNLYNNQRYFNEFYDINKLKDFDKYYSKYTTKINTNEKDNDVYKVTPSVYINRDAINEKHVHLISKKRYKLKELFYEYLKYHYEQYKVYSDHELQEQYGVYGYDGKTLGELLRIRAKDLHEEIKKPLQTNIRDQGFYLAIHTDIVAPRIIGDSISKVLYFGSRRTNDELDEIYIQNIQYAAVTKNYIEEISFIITNEIGERILFESGYKPISLTLKFEKIQV